MFVFYIVPHITYCQVIRPDSLDNKYLLDEVVVVGKDPISEKFSITKLSKMDIYFNPASNADPLKAIAVLPSSTNVDESANPSLRGGSPDRSRVYLNGAPILNPVRFGRDNGLGNFSLFNVDIIEKQYIYASNPPLTFGNSSAGLIQIETNDKLEVENMQYALTLSNIGLMINRKLSKNNFVQAYTNYQFDRPFLELNKSKLKELKAFKTFDFGLNTHFKFSENLAFNSFNYFISEDYSVLSNSFNFSSDAIAKKNRFFSVNNVDYSIGNSRIRYATMFDYSNSDFIYGAINSNVKTFQYFNSLGIKTNFARNLGVQYGVETSLFKNRYSEIFPLYYYALNPNSPTSTNIESVGFYYIEPYIYTNYEILSNFGISGAARKNLFLDKEAKNFTSFQFAAHYELNQNNRFILSAGKYHSYSTPNYYIRNYTLLNSKQVALDYYYETGKLNISSAVYYKSDKGDLILNNYERYDELKSFGLELNVNFPIVNHLLLNVSNTYLNQNQYIENVKYNSELNLKYFVKAQIVYNNPYLINTSLLFTTRPGNHYYTGVGSALFNDKANNYQPTFEELFSSTFSTIKDWTFQ